MFILPSALLAQKLRVALSPYCWFFQHQNAIKLSFVFITIFFNLTIAAFLGPQILLNMN